MNAIFSRFTKNSNSLNSETPISDEELMARFPSIFNPIAHESRSEKFTHVTTALVHEAMVKAGFKPYQVFQQNARPKGGSAAGAEAIQAAMERTRFKKHLIVYRHASQLSPEKHGCAGTTLLQNAADGSCRFRTASGLFEVACGNGLWFGDVFYQMSFTHTKLTVDAVIKAALDSVARLDDIIRWRETMQHTFIGPDERSEYAHEALLLNWESHEAAPIYAEQLFTKHRPGDCETNLWGAYQLVQENLRRGQLQKLALMDRIAAGLVKAPRALRKTGAITEIGASLRLENALANQANDWLIKLAA